MQTLMNNERAGRATGCSGVRGG